jgi:FAD dependent oxidoreductase TIGR03364
VIDLGSAQPEEHPGRVVVVGGGILGTWHALEAVRRGWEVVHLERDQRPQSASARNFGLIWVSGRAPGRELVLALRARAKWEELAADCPEMGFRAAGSLTVATGDEEWAALEAAVKLDDADVRQFALVNAVEARRLSPALGQAVVGCLYCRADALVEPRTAVARIQRWLEHRSPRYHWLPGREVTSLSGERVVDHTGDIHGADLVVFCPGASDGGLAREILAGAPLQRVALQMFETAPYPLTVGPAIANADSLRYYPAFAGGPRSLLTPATEESDRWRTQLLVTQRLDGSLTIGDTHRYDEPPAFDYDSRPEAWFVAAADAVTARPVPPVARRWIGVYHQCTDDRVYLRTAPDPGLVVVAGAGGRGMTLSPAIAEETFGLIEPQRKEG